MWLFEARGFYSIVAYDPKKDVVNDVHRELAQSSDDPDGWLLVRARVEEDLKVLEKISGVDIRITTDKSADYSFRGLITKNDFKAYLAKCVDQITYDSHFKEVVRANASQASERYSAMMKVWGAMSDLQPYSPYGGYTYVTTKAKETEPKTGSALVTNKGWSGTGTSGGGWDADAPDHDEEWWATQRYYEGVFGNTTDYSQSLQEIIDAMDDGPEDDEDWRRWQPGRVWNHDLQRWEDKPAAPVATTAPKFEEWLPSNYWFEVHNLRSVLATTPVGEVSNEDIESMTDETFGMWLEALDKYGPMHILSEAQITDLCGEATENPSGEEGTS